MNEKTTKIYIIGPAGSGKSFLANKISSHTLAITNSPAKNIPILDLDDIFWKVKYTEENSPSAKQGLLKEFLRNNPTTWIIEGAPVVFLKPVSLESTKVVWLNPSTNTLLYRVTKRFILAKFQTIKTYASNKQSKTLPPPETLKSFYKLLRGIISYKLKNDLYKSHREITNLNDNF